MQINVKTPEELVPLFIMDKSAHASARQLDKLVQIQDIPRSLKQAGLLMIVGGSVLASLAGLAVLWILKRKH